jgi:prepilin-type N-terminal cleavage/methylation domain-containing protein
LDVPTTYEQGSRWRELWMRKLGFTLVEVLIVIGILGILAGIALVLLQGPKEKARQTKCMSNLKSIYAAIEMYATDYPQSEPLHPAIDLPLGAFRNPLLLIKYTGTKESMYCPDTPPCARAVLGSSYNWNGYPVGETAAARNGRDQILARMDREGSNYPIVTCMAHDEVYYYPAERNLSMTLNSPFVIDLLASGSAHARRREHARTFDFARHCGQGAP